MNRKPWVGRALSAALLAGSLGACDFISVTESNPNAVPTANIDQLFTAIQVNTFFYAENQLSRIAAIWTQQLAGTDRQFSALDVYSQLSSSTADGEFSTIYTGGGLVDLRRAQALAETQNRRVYKGILQIHEAYLVGMTASIFGDIPYSEAVNPEITTPKVDEQAAVYAAVQALLDQAIANLQSGQGGTPGGVDLVFGGNAAKWIATANTLKARFYIHWVEAQQAGKADAAIACGGNCIQKAVAAAQSGIMSSANNWSTVHGAASTEENAFFQFTRDRSGYISAGFFGVNLLQERNDPRLQKYYMPGSAGGTALVGSKPGENLATAAQLNTGVGGVAAPTARQPIVSCAENQFILAEAQYYLGNAAAAQQALQAGVACEEARLGVTVPPVNASSLTGRALLTEILTQKYIALFLSVEVYNDFKRTCLPNLVSANGVNPANMPRRFFYGQSEQEANPNIPVPSDQPRANDNDPEGCPRTSLP